MINIQARAITDELASLVKEVDKLVGDPKDRSANNKAFVVLLTEDPDADAAKLEALAKEHGIKNTPLTIFDGSAGPRGYKIAEDATVTVMMWNRAKVEINHAFGDGELDKAAVEKVVADAKKFVQ